MNTTLCPGRPWGTVEIPSSKSQMHRLLICAALGNHKTEIRYKGTSKDILATINCLNALGAKIQEKETGLLLVEPVSVPEENAVLFCGESGSTLRFMLPVAGVLGVNAVFKMEGRLPERPLFPLDRELQAHGMKLEKCGQELHCSGKLTGGAFEIPGNISSQYVSGLLLALPRAEEPSVLSVTGKVESAPYILMTEDTLNQSGIVLEKNKWTYEIPPKQICHLPETVSAEGDYSNGAFFLSLGALSEKGVTVKGLAQRTSQGDRAVLEILQRFGAHVEHRSEGIFVKKDKLEGCVIDAASIPDLVPVLSVVASVSSGTTKIINAGRLRIKESDRLESTANLLRTLGGKVEINEDSLIIEGVPSLTGGTVNTYNDHRIAMSAATASAVCSGDVTILESQCVEKSYPQFWTDFQALKG